MRNCMVLTGKLFIQPLWCHASIAIVDSTLKILTVILASILLLFSLVSGWVTPWTKFWIRYKNKMLQRLIATSFSNSICMIHYAESKKEKLSSNVMLFQINFYTNVIKSWIVTWFKSIESCLFNHSLIHGNTFNLPAIMTQT